MKTVFEETLLVDTLARKGGTIEYIGPNTWVACFRKFNVPTPQEFEQTWQEHPTTFKSIKMFGKDVFIPRYQQAYGRSYAYSGNVSEAIEATPTIACLQDMLNDLIEARDSLQFNMCLCNWYEPHHYIGPHSDDTRQLVKESPIASLSWGGTRTFVLKPKQKTNPLYKAATFELLSGDLVIMGGECQTSHTHEIVKLKKSETSTNRINFTFRCFK
jgi:alkylated DNA repair dioxygenase AlkB